MSTDTPGTGGVDPQHARPDDTTIAADLEGTQDTEDTAPTPGSDNDGAEVGYTPPSETADGGDGTASGSDDPVSD